MKSLVRDLKKAIEWDTLNNWQKVAWVMVLVVIVPAIWLEVRLGQYFPDIRA